MSAPLRVLHVQPVAVRQRGQRLFSSASNFSKKSGVWYIVRFFSPYMKRVGTPTDGGKTCVFFVPRKSRRMSRQMWRYG